MASNYLKYVTLLAIVLNIFIKDISGDLFNEIIRIDFQPAVPLLQMKLCITPIFHVAPNHFLNKILFSYYFKETWINIYIHEPEIQDIDEHFKLLPGYFQNKIYLEDYNVHRLCLKRFSEESLFRYRWSIVIFPDSKQFEIFDKVEFNITYGSYNEAQHEILLNSVEFNPSSISEEKEFCLTLKYTLSAEYFIKAIILTAQIFNYTTTIYSIHSYNQSTWAMPYYYNKYPWEDIETSFHNVPERLCFRRVTSNIKKFKYIWFLKIEMIQNNYTTKYKSLEFHLPGVVPDVEDTNSEIAVLEESKINDSGGVKIKFSFVAFLMIAIVTTIVLAIAITMHIYKNRRLKRSFSYNSPGYAAPKDQAEVDLQKDEY